MQQQRGIFCYMGFHSEKTVIRCYGFTKKECKLSVTQLNCPGRHCMCTSVSDPGLTQSATTGGVPVCVCSPADLEVCCRKRTVGLCIMVKHLMMPTSFLALLSNWQLPVDSRAQLRLKDHWLKALAIKRGDGWEVLLLNTHMDIIHWLRMMAYFFSSYSV